MTPKERARTHQSPAEEWQEEGSCLLEMIGE